MRVIRGLSTNKDQPLTSPFPVNGGVFIELRGGDICDPVQVGGSNWFNPPYPKRVWRAFCKWPVLPFVSWQWGDIRGYVGFKAYGVDSDAYKHWIAPSEVFAGSYALCTSCRPLAGFKQRMLNILIAFDQLVYVLLTLGYGNPDETLSSAAWRAERDGKFFGFTRPMIDWLMSWNEKDHCLKSYQNEAFKK